MAGIVVFLFIYFFYLKQGENVGAFFQLAN